MSETKEEKKKRKDLDKIELNSSILGFDNWESKNNNTKPVGFGICSSCKNFEYVKTEFDLLYTGCYPFRKMNVPLTNQKPITECTEFEKTGTLSIREMYDMAILIDDKKEKTVGFK